MVAVSWLSGFSRCLPGRHPPAWVSWDLSASTYALSLSPVIGPVHSKGLDPIWILKKQEKHLVDKNGNRQLTGGQPRGR